jgi:aminopeptidase N
LAGVNRLYKNFAPSIYNITLAINKAKLKFSGRVEVIGRRIGRPSKRITFHAEKKYIKIVSAKIIKLKPKKDENPEVKISRIYHHPSSQELRLHSDTTIYPGEYKIELEYEAVIPERELDGLYKSTFVDEDGNEDYLLTTQFESHFARNAIPMIDEPEAKAEFNLNLILSEDEYEANQVLFNTEPAEVAKLKASEAPIQIPDSNSETLVSIKFKPTPIMSSYLAALIIGRLKSKQKTLDDGTLLRAWAAPGKEQNLEFALAEAETYLKFYNDFFGIKYPLEKCDLVAVPDFESGAMENWGLITFRESALLVDEGSDLSHKQYVSLVVAHELSHMWFGNLVTMKWWEDLWLNENFAAWMEFYAMDHAHPDWQVFKQFIESDMQPSMGLDALDNTHSIVAKLKNPSDIRTSFDIITYQKGSNMINMLHQFLGDEIFKEGIRAYMQKFAYKNAERVDLWRALSFVSKKDVANFMDSWVAQPGFPEVKVERDGSNLSLTQERFFLNPPEKANNQLWQLPAGSEVHKGKKAKLKNPKSLYINKNQAGYFVTNYSSELVKDLVSEAPKLNPQERMGLLFDIFMLAQASRANNKDFWAVAGIFNQEEDEIVWRTVSRTIAKFKLVYGNIEDVSETLRDFTLGLTNHNFKRLGLEPKAGESENDFQLRATILAMRASVEDEGVISWAKLKFNEANDIAELDPELKATILSSVAKLDSASDFNKMEAWYFDDKVSDEDKRVVSAAMTGFKSENLLNRCLKLILDDKIRTQDIVFWIAYMATGRYSAKLTWNWLTENWPRIRELLVTENFISRVPVYVSRSLWFKEFEAEFTKFWEANYEPCLNLSIKQGIESIQINGRWLKQEIGL